jgi:hypothetical protein
MKKIIFTILMIISFVSVSAEIAGQIHDNYTPEKNWPAVVSGAEVKGKNLKIYLVTAGRMNTLSDFYSWWGHASLKVERYNKQGLVSSFTYDYGIFNFNKEGFIKNFIKGRLDFLAGENYSEPHERSYVSKNRQFIIQELDLPYVVRWQVAEFLKQNSLPKNREYSYHHYFNNCVTVLRDILNKATDGQLEKKSKAVPGRMTIRQHARRFMTESYAFDWVLNFLQGSMIDGEITKWEEMYLPSEMMNYLKDFTYRDSNGIERKLVKSTVMKKHEGSIPMAKPERRKNEWLLSLFAGLGFGFLGAFLLSMGAKFKGFRIIGGIYYAFFYFLLFILGFVLFFMMTFTNHDVTYNNMNIIFVNPGFLLLFIFSIMYAAGSKVGRVLMIVFQWLFFVAAATALVLNLTNVSIQDNMQILAFILPFYFLTALAALYRNYIPKRRKKV